MEVLVKETVTLHKVLSRYLPSSVVEYVMTQVFAAINHRLSEEYTKIELPSLEAKERLLADARFLQEKLTGLKNVAAPTAMLETIVSEKPVAIKQPPPQQQQQQQPVVQPAAQPGGRFKGMLARAGTLNGRKASMPAPAPAAHPLNLEKALPPPSISPSPGLTPSPGSDPLTSSPRVDPMGDNSPSPALVPAKAAPPPPPLEVTVTEEPLANEPESTDADGSPPQTPPKAERSPSVKDLPQQNGAANAANGDNAIDTVTVDGNADASADTDTDARLPAPPVSEMEQSLESAS
ncbi:hypothetical protein BD309DRAFT_619296 [Dichomitus squalens]|nr:hypothetical protein BD309DRAFT_619296 [Dichomitus squalens]